MKNMIAKESVVKKSVITLMDMFKWVPDSIYLKVLYFVRNRKILDLKHPYSFNEKLQWLKIHDHNFLYPMMVDKYEVRKYISEKIGEDFLIPILGIWENPNDVDFDNLPDKFVLKCTHDSGGVIICRNKAELNVKDVKKWLENRMKRNFYYSKREWPYLNIKPRIIAEKYMEQSNGSLIRDYKLHCFNGIPKMTLVCSDRDSEGKCSKVFYDEEWNKMPLKRKNSNNNVDIERPNEYSKMIEIAKLLSKDIPFLRVDLYEIENKIYFGELTFFPASGLEGFEPACWDDKLGAWLNISSIQK